MENLTRCTGFMNNQSETDRKWQVLVLAASRGPNDPMAERYGVSHKCLIEVGGKPMLARVVDTLLSHRAVQSVGISIEDDSVLAPALGADAKKIQFHQSQNSAPASVLSALAEMDGKGPVLVTTADHALLDHQMLDHFFAQAGDVDADLLVGLARDEVILKAYPDAKRTFLKFGPDRVSGCNMFAFKTERAQNVLSFWQRVEKNRKNPFKLIAAFGLKPLIAYVTGSLNLEKAFELASDKIGVKARPLLLPFANAAVDVDKPEDKELVEEILARG